MSEPTVSVWIEALRAAPGWPVLPWLGLLAVAALAGHLAQRHAGLPKITGHAVVGMAAGLAGLTGTAWPLGGPGRFMLTLGIAVVLFEAGARLSWRWFRHNPMVLAQSVAEALLTLGAAWLALHALGLPARVAQPLAVIAVAASPAVLIRVVADLRASGPVTERAITLATLNTLYALTLGVAWLRLAESGPGALAATLGALAGALLASLALGALLALLLAAALRVMRPASGDAVIVTLALIAAGTAVGDAFGASAPLAALLGGSLLRQLHARPWLWPGQWGTAATTLNVLMFVLVAGVAAQGPWQWGGAALALVGVRMGAKLLSVVATSAGSGLGWRKALWTGCALAPMSAVALLLTAQFAAAAPATGALVAGIALPVILLNELLGAALAAWALRRAGEAGRPWQPPPGAGA